MHIINTACISFILLTILLLFFSCKDSENDSVRGNLNESSISGQFSTKRIWKEIKIEEEFHIHNDSLYYPLSIIVDHNDDIFIYDLAVQKIKLVGPNHIVEYGKGKGNGPEEFANIVDFKTFKDTLYIADSQLRKIVLFNKNGKFIKTLKFDHGLHRIEITKHGIVILPSSIHSEEYFVLYNSHKKVIKNFGKRIDLDYNPMKRPFISEGILCSDKLNRIFFGFTYVGILMQYNLQSGNHQYIKTIETIPVPDIEMILGGRGAKAPRGGPVSCRSLSYTNNKIYVLAGLANSAKTEESSVIDVYNSQNIEYLYSFTIPYKVNRIAIKNDHIYAILNKKEIFSWIFQENSYNL